MKNVKGVNPGTAMWLCPLCGNLTALQVNKYRCVCECKERHGEEPELHIYLGYSIVIEDGKIAIHGGYDYGPAETTVYRFYSIHCSTVYSMVIAN
tara:strand:- start:116 stop:400 length:285 start_codon:yes stop_codon:yes gene_type:complete